MLKLVRTTRRRVDQNDIEDLVAGLKHSNATVAQCYRPLELVFGSTVVLSETFRISLVVWNAKQYA